MSESGAAERYRSHQLSMAALAASAIGHADILREQIEAARTGES